MRVYRLTDVFQMTTVANDATVAVSRTGGWTEGFWTNALTDANDARWNSITRRRAIMLPSQAAVVGWRIATYDIVGNKLVPAGTESGRQFVAGNPSFPCDVPQMALFVSAAAIGAPNGGRLNLHAIPDPFVITGEYSPSAAFKAAFTSWANAQKGTGFGWIGRDLTQPAMRVLAYAANVLRVSAAIPGLAAGDFVRLHRVRDDNGDAVKGVFLVDGVVGTSITLNAGPSVVITKPSGTVRKDVLTFLQFGDLEAQEVFQKKVGAPSRRYRGRRSKSRA